MTRYIEAVKDKLEQMAQSANVRIIWERETERTIGDDSRLDLSFIVVKL